MPAGAQQLCPTSDFTSRFHDSALVGSAALQWQPSSNSLVYASVSRGYKAGGLNLDRTGGLAGAAGSTFLPEEVDNYEFGAKGRFLDGRARLALTLFTANIRNFQQNAFNGIAFTISNAAAVRSRGLELEATLRPARWFSFNTSLVYNEATYGDATETVALRGRQIVNAPRWTWQSQMQIDQPLGSSGWTAQISANARLLSDINTSVSLIPQAEQDGYVLLGGRLGLRSPGGRWDISAFVQNLTNQYYRTIVFAGVIQPGTFNAYVGEPRTFGLEARMRF